jgi:hypothetical protein
LHSIKVIFSLIKIISFLDGQNSEEQGNCWSFGSFESEIGKVATRIDHPERRRRVNFIKIFNPNPSLKFFFFILVELAKPVLK